MVFMAVLASTTIIRSFSHLLRRERHKQLILEVHKMNRRLGGEIQKYPSINMHFLWTLFMTLLMNAIFLAYAIYGYFAKASFTNLLSFLLNFDSCYINDVINQCVNEEMQKQFGRINRILLERIENYLTDEQDDVPVMRVVEMNDIHFELQTLSIELNDHCSVAILTTLATHWVLLVWLWHTIYVLALFLMEGKFVYTSVIIISIMRMLITVFYVEITIKTWTSIKDEVSSLFSQSLSS